MRVYAKSDLTHVPEVATKTTPGSVMRSALWGRSSGTSGSIKDGVSAAGGKGGLEYRLWHEFQSHEAEFDYLKSLEIEEKINCLRFPPPSPSSQIGLVAPTSHQTNVNGWLTHGAFHRILVAGALDQIIITIFFGGLALCTMTCIQIGPQIVMPMLHSRPA